MNLYYCVGKHEFWYKKLTPYLSRENLEKVFRARSEKQKGTSQVVKKPVSQKPILPTPSDTPEPEPQSKSVVIPPLPDGFIGARIAHMTLTAIREGRLYVPISAIPMILSASIIGYGMISRLTNLDVN